MPAGHRLLENSSGSTVMESAWHPSGLPASTGGRHWHVMVEGLLLLELIRKQGRQIYGFSISFEALKHALRSTPEPNGRLCGHLMRLELLIPRIVLAHGICSLRTWSRASNQCLCRLDGGPFRRIGVSTVAILFSIHPLPIRIGIFGRLSLADSKVTPFLQTEFNEMQGAISPDGRWLAYTSDETGSAQIYIQRFPSAGHKLQISTGGGYEPKWSPTGKELFYISRDRKLTTVEFAKGPGSEAGLPRELFELPVPELSASFPNTYAVAADGQRFLVNTAVRHSILLAGLRCAELDPEAAVIRDDLDPVFW